MPVSRAARPGTASYPGPAEGCRLLQPCRANIRGRGKRPVSSSLHEMSQPVRKNQGSLSAVLARLQPRFIFFPSEELLLLCDLLVSQLCPAHASALLLPLPLRIFCSQERPSHGVLMCLRGSATGLGLPLLPGSLLLWHYLPAALAAPLL